MRARLIKKADIESLETEKQAQAPPPPKATNVRDWVREHQAAGLAEASARSVRERFALLFQHPRAANG